MQVMRCAGCDKFWILSNGKDTKTTKALNKSVPSIDKQFLPFGLLLIVLFLLPFYAMITIGTLCFSWLLRL